VPTMWEKSAGRLRYSPKLLGEHASEKWWLVLDCDPEIGRYYRHLFSAYRFHAEQIERPAWKEHITVIRDEEPLDNFKSLWEKYEGQSVEFLYHTEPQSNGEYWWLNVECEFLLMIRTELGLKREPHYPLHLSIGHMPMPST